MRKRRARRQAKLAAVVIALVLAQTQTLAAVTLTIRGEVDAVTDKQVVVRTKTSVYHIKRDALAKPEQDALKEKGKQVTVSIPSDAVEQVAPRDEK